MDGKPKAFLICPVRNVTEEYIYFIEQTIKSAEISYDLYYPARDTNQEDDTGLRICEDNLKAIQEAEEVFIIWDGKSQGCLFDLGMAFALGKVVVPVVLPPKTDGKSFQSMIVAYFSKKLKEIS